MLRCKYPLGMALFLAVASLTNWTTAQQPAIEKYDPKKTYAASPVPDRIMLTWPGDPRFCQAVTWRTDLTVRTPIAEIAVSGDGPKFASDVRKVCVTSTVLETNLGSAKYHTAVFSDLKPETQYAYRVGDGTNWSEWSQFQTASNSAKPFSFIYFGDAQNNIKFKWSRVIREAFKESPRAAFLLHCGDLVDQANNDIHWAEWFYAGGWINRTMPSIATPGNHEQPGGNLSILWRRIFAFPQHGPASLEETVYFIDYQGLRIVSLNSSKNLDAQVKWFDEMMKSNRNRWTIVAMHHPVFSTAEDRDNKDLREKLKPLFDRHKIDMVLQGHDHTYGRTGLVDHTHVYQPEKKDEGKKDDTKKDDTKTGDSGKQPKKTKRQKGKRPVHQHAHTVQNVPTGLMTRSQESGTMYVVSVSGPKQYKTQQNRVFRRLGQDMQLYQIISIDGDELTFSAYTATGKLFDRFVLQKRNAAPNRLIEIKK